MPRLHAFTTSSSSIAAEQPHRRTQIPSTNIKPERHQQPSLCVAPSLFLHLHSQNIKRKCVTDPLNEAVRARLCGNLPITDMTNHCSTSGSCQDIDSERLADMIYNYGIVDQDGSQGDHCSPSNFTKDCEIDVEGSNTRDNFMLFQLCEILKGVCSRIDSAFELRLLRNVKKAIAIDKGNAGFNGPENSEQKNRSRRFVMNSLQFAGYNAAVCKSRWERTIRYPAGDYEFIDVVIEGSKLKYERFFVDIDFRAQFEIARPTADYNALLQKLPTLFVGRADKLCSIVKIMCDAARRSLKEKEMFIPPWRKYRYMQAKWVGSCKRITNPGSTATENSLLQFPYPSIKLRATGWNASVVEYQIEKGNMVFQENFTAKSKSTEQGNEPLESCDCLFQKGNRDRHVNRISGLATALSEAGLMPVTPPTEPDTCVLQYKSLAQLVIPTIGSRLG